MRYLTPLVVLSWLLLLWVCYITGGNTTGIKTLKHHVVTIQEMQQKQLNLFSDDAYNMRRITNLLKSQAEILREIERRTR